MSLEVRAFIFCDHGDCKAVRIGAQPLRFGQLNPIQLQELQTRIVEEGWTIVPAAVGETEHYCPRHTPITVIV